MQLIYLSASGFTAEIVLSFPILRASVLVSRSMEISGWQRITELVWI